MSFNPDRFLGAKPAPDPQNFVFGFGRRICPGRVLAENSLYLNVAQSLAVYSISRGEAEEEPEIKFTPGVVSHPEPFPSVIKPRSKYHEALIRAVEKKYPWQESDGKILDSMK